MLKPLPTTGVPAPRLLLSSPHLFLRNNSLGGSSRLPVPAKRGFYSRNCSSLCSSGSIQQSEIINQPSAVKNQKSSIPPFVPPFVSQKRIPSQPSIYAVHFHVRPGKPPSLPVLGAFPRAPRRGDMGELAFVPHSFFFKKRMPPARSTILGATIPHPASPIQTS